MAKLDVRVEFHHNGVHISASALAREVASLHKILYSNALLIVASEIRKRIQSHGSLWPKPPTPPHIQRKRTGLSQSGMYIHATGRTVVVSNDVYYAPYVNYARVFTNSSTPNWNYLAVERTLARDWLRIRNASHRKARSSTGLRPIGSVPGGSRVGELPDPTSGFLLPIVIWDEEEEEQDDNRRVFAR